MEREQALPSVLQLERGEVLAPELEGLGVLSAETRVNALHFALDRKVVPRLAALGLDAQALWSRRHSRGSAGSTV
jgi:hypothetical protein